MVSIICNNLLLSARAVCSTKGVRASARLSKMASAHALIARSRPCYQKPLLGRHFHALSKAALNQTPKTYIAHSLQGNKVYAAQSRLLLNYVPGYWNYPYATGNRFLMLRYQIRRFTTDTQPVKKTQTIKERILGDPNKIKYAKRAFYIALLIGAGAIYIENRDQPPTISVPKYVDSAMVKGLKEFVREFNIVKSLYDPAKEETKKEMNQKLQEAIRHVDDLRYLGKLTPIQNAVTKEDEAAMGLLVLTECDDAAIQSYAFENLETILKGLDPHTPLSSLLKFESILGEKLISLNEINDSIPLLQEYAVCYGFALEKIFLVCLASGANLDKHIKSEVIDRARKIGFKLKQNPVFCYESMNALVLANHFKSTSKPVTTLVTEIPDIINLYKDVGGELESLWLAVLSKKVDIGEIRKFLLSKGPDLFKKVEDKLGVIESIWRNIEKSTDYYELVFLLRPNWQSNFRAAKDIDSLSKTIDIVLAQSNHHSPTAVTFYDRLFHRENADWVVSYRLVDILSDILFSRASDDVLREKALAGIRKIASSNVPWQVKAKIGITFAKLREDPLLQYFTDENLNITLTNDQSKVTRALNWYGIIQKTRMNTDRRLQKMMNIGFSPSGKMRHSNEDQNHLLIVREEAMEKLKTNFQESTLECPVQIIQGISGAGKSTLARTFAQKYGRDYSRVYWTDAPTFESDLEKYADEEGLLHLTKRPEKLDRMKKILEEDSKGWLLIIDGLDSDNSDEIEALKSILPKKGGHVLITTYRLHLVEDKFPSSQVLKLGVFSALESVHFLVQNKFPDIPKKEVVLGAKKFAEKSEYLPKILELGRKEVELSHLTYADIAQDVAGKNDKIRNICNAIKIKIPFAIKLLNFVSNLYSGEISWGMIEKWQKKFYPELSGMLKTALNSLLEHALLEGKNKENDGIYKIHSSIQEAALTFLDKDEKEKIYSEVLEVLCNDIDLEDPKNWKMMDGLKPHFEKIASNAYAKEFVEPIARMQKQLGLYYFIRADYGKAKSTTERSLELMRTNRKSKKDPELIELSNQLLRILTKKGEYDGARSLAAELDLTRKDGLGATSLELVGNLHSISGDYLKAKESFDKALEIRRGNLVTITDQLDLARCLNSIGIVLAVMEDLQGAKAKHLEELEIKKKIYGTEEVPEIADSIHYLGNILVRSGEYEEAEKNYLKSYGIRIKVFETENHPDVAASLFVLGELAKLRNKVDVARNYYEGALRIREKVYQRHISIAACKLRLGELFIIEGKLENAQDAFGEGFSLMGEIDPKQESPFTADYLIWMGALDLAQNQLDKAKEKTEAALKIYRARYPKNHPAIADGLCRLGQILNKQGKVDEGVFCCQLGSAMYEVMPTGKKHKAAVCDQVCN